MAISGLHIGLVAAFAALILRGLFALSTARVHQRRFAVIGAVVAAIAFTAFSGADVPARRACLMLVVGALATLSWRTSSPWTVLSIAGTVLLIVDALAALTTGFVMSFAAVAVLILTFRGYTPHSYRLRAFHALLRAQLWLLFGLLPVGMLAAGLPQPLAAPFANLVAVPVFSALTVPLTLTGSVLAPAAIGDSLLRIAAMTIEFLDALLLRLAGLPSLGAAGWLALPVLAWVVLPRRFPGRFVAIVAVVALVFRPPPGIPRGCIDTHFLDVGQGTSILVETAAHRLLYDTGPGFDSGASAATRQVLPVFAATARTGIDRLVVSHADLDHAGGIDDVVASLSPDVVLAGEPLPRFESVPCRVGQAWIWDDVLFRIEHPHEDDAFSGNDASCVLRASVGDASLLLTGDIEIPAERELLRRGLEPATVVSVPHHGSRTSSTFGFVRTVNAERAVVSSGFMNRWRLPVPAIVERWTGHGTEVDVLSETGMLSLQLCPEGVVSVTRFRR
jgi:competence protein ComEC